MDSSTPATISTMPTFRPYPMPMYDIMASRMPDVTRPRLARPRQVKTLATPISLEAMKRSMVCPVWCRTMAMIMGQTMADRKYRTLSQKLLRYRFPISIREYTPMIRITASARLTKMMDVVLPAREDMTFLRVS